VAALRCLCIVIQLGCGTHHHVIYSRRIADAFLFYDARWEASSANQHSTGFGPRVLTTFPAGELGLAVTLGLVAFVGRR